MHHPDYLKRDTGGWTNMRTLVQFFGRHKQSCMGPVDDYVRAYGSQFATLDDAKEAAFIALLSGTRGSRMALLVAAAEVVTPLSSASGHAGADGRRTTMKIFLKPIAIRANGGQSSDRQPFLRESR